MSEWAKTLTFPFTGTRKQPHNIILPAPTFTAGTVHSGRQCFLLFTKPRLNSVWCPDCQIEKRDEIYHCSTFPFLHSPAVACFTSLKPTLALQGDGAAMATHTMKLPVLMLKSEDFENLQLLSQQSTGDYLLCHFFSRIAVVRERFDFAILPLTIQLTGDCLEEISPKTCCSCAITADSSEMFVKTDSMNTCLISFISDNAIEWNTWIEWLRCGSVYSPYSVHWSHGPIAFVAE